MPRRVDSQEGKRHVKTVPIKLIKAQTSEHKSHIDTDFCVASIRALDSLASFFGPEQVFYLSQDDKARIPLGIPAVQKQAAVLMHMEYKVTLPDHDWVKADKHKLIPSVYAGINIKPFGMGETGRITYSGPTVIRIRSGKHDSSSAAGHAMDLRYILKNEIFKSISQTTDGEVKPVVIVCSDGGPDENPRYESVIRFAIDNFKMYDLDGYFAVTNAPGRSAFNM